MFQFGKKRRQEIGKNRNRISVLAPKSTSKEISPKQGSLDLEVEKDIGGIGLGVLSDGTPYLNQRGLAVLCGVQNAHIGTISTGWNEPEQKPRITAIKNILAKAALRPQRPISKSSMGAGLIIATLRRFASPS